MTTGGFSFGTAATQGAVGQAGTVGFSFANTSKPVGTATPIAAAAFSTPVNTSAPPPALPLGLGPAPTAATGFSFATAPPPSQTSSGSLTLGIVKPTTNPAPTGGLALGGLVGSTAPTSTSTFGTSTNLTLGGASFATPLGVGGLGATSSSSGFTGFATSKPTLTLGGIGTATTGVFSASAAPPTAGFSVGGALGGGSLTAATSATPSLGLGGVDPKDSTASTYATGAAGKPRDSKATKEAQVPAPICQTVEDFKRHVKSQKQEYEKISRMSSKNLFRVQEEVSSLKQLLALVSNGLQRNAVAINNLKFQSAQELKFAEIAQRTKDTPAGLQYENTAPVEYFQNLMVDFEQRMVTYRQQIEQTETYISSMNQETALKPQELSALMLKLHSSFISLAAHLQMVHEAVKAQKEHYLNYRKVFHDDTTDIFERRKKAEQKTGSSVVTTTVGPTPFTGMSNSAAMAMAAAINRTPQQAAAGATGLTGLGQPTGLTAGGFGTSNTLMGTGATSTVGLFGSNKPTTGFGLGATTTAPSLFGSTTTTPATAFGATTGFGTATNTSFGFGQQNTVGTFQLQKPPVGNKRNKNA